MEREDDGGASEGSPETEETIEVAFTVEVVVLPLPADREPPLPRPAVDAARRDRHDCIQI